jgi:ribosomal-protein-alanine N-acetyltransferase
MKKSDLDQVLAIEKGSFLMPWLRSHFLNEFHREYSVQLVAEAKHKIIGYLICWFEADAMHIANLAIHPEWRRQGIAHRLIQKLIKDQQWASLVWLEVRPSNYAARLLYKKMGFSEKGIREKYYVDEGEDAILMVKWLHFNGKG